MGIKKLTKEHRDVLINISERGGDCFLIPYCEKCPMVDEGCLTPASITLAARKLLGISRSHRDYRKEIGCCRGCKYLTGFGNFKMCGRNVVERVTLSFGCIHWEVRKRASI